ncbi:MAG: hypothetical protein R6W90_05140 [Ignavibacteriaceae bacterium]
MEFEHNQNKDLLKRQIDNYVSKLNKLEFNGNFKIVELHKNWINYEMNFSVMVKQGFLERRIKGLIQIKDELIIIEFEVPEIVKNFVREEKLKFLISKHMDNVLEDANFVLKE